MPPSEVLTNFSIGAATQYEHALLDAAKKGIKITALIICNPHNPLGRLNKKTPIFYRVYLIQDFLILTISRFMLYYRLPERALRLL